MTGTETIEIGGGRLLGLDQPTVVVAEIGQNHNGNVEKAEELVDAAAWAGVDAVKFVKRDIACELSLDARDSAYENRNSFGKTYGLHRQALELSHEDHARLARRVRERGLLYFSTACDAPSARLLQMLNVDVLKVASRDLANLPLIEKLARTGTPLFLSTGMSALEEIDAAVRVLRTAGARFALLQCTSLYPTPFAHSHLRSLQTLAERYETLVGFSDHSRGILLPPVAVAMGARIIEKHLTLDRSAKGTDHACSLEPEEFRQMVENIRDVELSLGSSAKPVAPGVDRVRERLGRSLVSRFPLAAGTEIQEPMLALKCPGDGLTWFDRSLVVGKVLKRDVRADEKLALEHFV